MCVHSRSLSPDGQREDGADHWLLRFPYLRAIVCVQVVRTSMKGCHMLTQAFEILPGDTPNYDRIADLVLELEVATRLLYDRSPEPQKVMPVYRYIEDALREIRDELIKIDDRPC